MSLIPDEAMEMYVVRLDTDRAELIRRAIPPQLFVDEDAVLDYETAPGLSCRAGEGLAAWNSSGAIETRPVRIRVIGEGDKPLANVGVSLAGDGFPQEGRTDKRGEVTLPLMGLAGWPARALYARAPANYWDHYLGEPELSESEMNVVRLRPIEQTIAGFPEHYRYGWGQLQMGLDRVPDNLTGRGIKIAIVDSGVDTSHSLLRHIRLGVDMTHKADGQSWTQDLIGHGSHAAGIIAARDESGKMLRGFAPEAEVHVVKIVPGGRLSSLIEALDYCLERDIDIAYLGVVTRERSMAVEQKLEEAAANGLACIVADGDARDRMQYAAPTFSLSVAAVGRLHEYPDTAWDATTIRPELVAPDGIFWSDSSSARPDVVCAPGVAIVSTVPGGFAPLSGAAVAASHVTGLAAILLAHHPVFQGPLGGRSPQRVAALFNAIRSLCVPYSFGPGRTAGLPRLHGLESVLRLPISPTGRQSWAGVESGAMGTAPAPLAGGPFPHQAGFGLRSMASLNALLGAQEPGALVDPVSLTPLYVQSALAAQVWPVQALLESLRRQYLGS
jgi:subtilisin family serine protease